MRARIKVGFQSKEHGPVYIMVEGQASLSDLVFLTDEAELEAWTENDRDPEEHVYVRKGSLHSARIQEVIIVED